jgi:hypothetical protein
MQENARIVGAALLPFLTKRNWTAFEGRGHALVEITRIGSVLPSLIISFLKERKHAK